MTSIFLKKDLMRDEGLRLEAYPDPLTGGHPWTIGYGHTGLEVHPGLVWTEAQAEQQLDIDIASFEHGLDEEWIYPWWRSMNDFRQDCFVNMAFNLGVHKFMEFGTFQTLCRDGKFPQAALDLRGTPWFYQVGERAKRIAQQILTGEHQE